VPDETTLDRAVDVASVYVHAPFCVRRCFYCDFAVKVRPSGGPEPWLDAVAAELEAVAREGLFVPTAALDTLYVGGGTPSLLGPDAMDSLGELIGRSRLGAPSLEWTAEANPESFTADVAAAWRAAGVNRLSFGVQSFHPAALSWMGRLHGPEGARSAIRTARAAGFDNLSVDLIFGLPSHLDRSWRADLEAVLALDVDHVSLYGLTVEERTPLGRAVREGRAPPVDEEQYREEYLLASDMLVSEGFEHYEVSNFARPGRASRHNAAYWDGRPYLGLGNGAHSFAPPLRRWNLRDWDAYARAVAQGTVPEEGRETVEAGAARLERIWLALRTASGIGVAALAGAARDRVARWIQDGLAAETRGTVRLTAEGWLLLDRLAIELDDLLGGPTAA